MFIRDRNIIKKKEVKKLTKSEIIKNLDKLVIDENNQIFHAGTYEKDKKIFSNGGRVLNITSLEKTLDLTRKKCLQNLQVVNMHVQ